MRTSAAIVLVVIASAVAGCNRNGSSRSLSGPSPVPVTASPAVALPLSGYVGDTGFRPIVGARVEVLDGQQAGTVMFSGADGHFSYPGAFAGAANMRATKEGYNAATSPTYRGTDVIYVGFGLAPLAAPVRVAGNYTLTIVADPTCTQLPVDARTRSYEATLTPNTAQNLPANTRFIGGVTGGPFAPYANMFWAGVAGDYVGVSVSGEGPSIVAQIGPNRYVAYDGSAGATVTGPEVSTLSAPFSGLIEYCELSSPIGSYYDCSPSRAVVREQCTSANSRLILTRR